MSKRKKLLILHCYGVYHRGVFHADYPEYVRIYEQQLRESFRLLDEGCYDVLVISGGYTKPEAEKSEARGMLDWADELELPRKKGIALLEEYAKDSFENLLFSTCRFFQFFGEFPGTVHSCTWKLNTERFGILARQISLPRFQVIPVGRRVGEEEIAHKWAELAEEDPFYLKQSDSKEKYQKRDPWRKSCPYGQIDEDFRRLFDKLAELKSTGGNPREAKNLIPWR